MRHFCGDMKTEKGIAVAQGSNVGAKLTKAISTESDDAVLRLLGPARHGGLFPDHFIPMTWKKIAGLAAAVLGTVLISI